MDENSKLYLRFFHAVSDAPAVDLFVNDKYIDTLSYKGFTEYYPALNGTYMIRANLKGTDKVVLEEKVGLSDDIYTFALTGLASDISANLITSDNEKPDKNKAIIRFANLAPFDTDFDIYINSMKGVIGLNYEEITEFFSLDAGTHSLKVVDQKTGETKLLDPKLVLKKGNIYTGYIIGVENAGSGLQIVIPLEGATYITM